MEKIMEVARLGDDAAGWFWLPPKDLWALSAREVLEKNRQALA
ncbi:hypothetical protein [Sinorhizobium meliloti]